MIDPKVAELIAFQAMGFDAEEGFAEVLDVADIAWLDGTLRAGVVGFEISDVEGAVFFDCKLDALDFVFQRHGAFGDLVLVIGEEAHDVVVDPDIFFADRFF